MAEAKKGKANLKRKREELRALSVDELRKQLAEKREQLMQDRFAMQRPLLRIRHCSRARGGKSPGLKRF